MLLLVGYLQMCEARSFYYDDPLTGPIPSSVGLRPVTELDIEPEGLAGMLNRCSMSNIPNAAMTVKASFGAPAAGYAALRQNLPHDLTRVIVCASNPSGTVCRMKYARAPQQGVWQATPGFEPRAQSLWEPSLRHLSIMCTSLGTLPTRRESGPDATPAPRIGPPLML